MRLLRSCYCVDLIKRKTRSWGNPNRSDFSKQYPWTIGERKLPVQAYYRGQKWLGKCRNLEREKPGNPRSDSLESPSLFRVGRMSITHTSYSPLPECTVFTHFKRFGLTETRAVVLLITINQCNIYKVPRIV
jgi:hypothetical protein